MIGNSGNKMAVLAAALVMPGLALCQNISVIVNGEAVSFPGIGPQQVNGRVLVPLRGIMEKLGAYVDYNSSARTVTANKSGIDLMLKLGDRRAMLNGHDVTLDVPAQEIRGSTMVPLRFVGETLGAEVRWDAATYTVNITTTAGNEGDSNQYTPPRNNPPARGDVAITSFDMDHRGTIRGGEAIRLTLVGTPGGSATFSIPGVIQDVQMNETDPGTYVGTFRVPANSPVNISSATAIARLRVGGVERMIQSGSTLGFDTEAPMITSFNPGNNSRVGRPRPNISISFDDRGGSGIDPQSVEIRVDGRNVTREATITESSLSYRPTQPLESGPHEVMVRAMDRAGNPVTKTWTFQVMSNRDAIKDFTFDGGPGQDMRPGSEVTFTLVGDPGGQATFSVGDRVMDRPMRETSPGKYVGTYTIRRNDNFADVPVTAKLVTSTGDSFTYDAQNRFNTRIDSLEPPTITSPIEGDTIKDTLVLHGTAAPGSTIMVKVDYSRTELGLIRVTGTAADMEVIADDQGRWQTEPIDLKVGLGKGTTFNVTAATVGLNGKRSAIVKLTLHK